MFQMKVPGKSARFISTNFSSWHFEDKLGEMVIEENGSFRIETFYVTERIYLFISSNYKLIFVYT